MSNTSFTSLNLPTFIGVFISFLLFVATPTTASDFERWAVHNPNDKNSINHSPMSNIFKFIHDPKSSKGVVVT